MGVAHLRFYWPSRDESVIGTDSYLRGSGGGREMFGEKVGGGRDGGMK